MADRKQELLGRLADLSEASIQRLAEAPVADRAVQALKGLADRVDELQRRTRGVENLEKRLTALEKKVDYLSRAKAPRRSSSAGRSRTGTAKKKPSSTAKKT